MKPVKAILLSVLTVMVSVLIMAWLIEVSSAPSFSLDSQTGVCSQIIYEFKTTFDLAI